MSTSQIANLNLLGYYHSNKLFYVGAMYIINWNKYKYDMAC